MGAVPWIRCHSCALTMGTLFLGEWDPHFHEDGTPGPYAGRAGTGTAPPNCHQIHPPAAKRPSSAQPQTKAFCALSLCVSPVPSPLPIQRFDPDSA